MSWLEAIPSSVAALEERPQFNLPSFPWKEFEEAFGHHFSLQNWDLLHKEKGWVKWSESDKEGFYLSVFVSSISTPVFFFMTKENLYSLIEVFFAQKERVLFLERSVAEAFYHFMGLEVLKMIDHLQFANHLSFYIGNLPANYQELLQKEAVFQIDLSVKTEKGSMLGTLLVPSSFRSLLKKEFPTPAEFVLREGLKEKVVVDLSLEAGHVQLLMEEFKAIKPGDFLLLDHLSFDPESKEGSLILTLNGEGIYRAKIVENGIKILDFPKLEEGRKTMQEDEFEFGGSGTSSQIPLDKIPVQITVEVAKLKMSLEELSSLSVGSLLELPLRVEEGISLLVNGKEVGRGELVKIGDVMGVRIINI